MATSGSFVATPPARGRAARVSPLRALALRARPSRRHPRAEASNPLISHYPASTSTIAKWGHFKPSRWGQAKPSSSQAPLRGESPLSASICAHEIGISDAAQSRLPRGVSQSADVDVPPRRSRELTDPKARKARPSMPMWGAQRTTLVRSGPRLLPRCSLVSFTAGAREVPGLMPICRTVKLAIASTCPHSIGVTKRSA